MAFLRSIITSAAAIASIAGVVGGTYLTVRALQWAKGTPYQPVENEETAYSDLKLQWHEVVSEEDMKYARTKHPGHTPYKALTSPWWSRD
ncbi:hypothetical protein BDV33DRAFT_198103 [Aspergillus novoparasiticus]|uniref:Uncharacterized protein n=1 Tax=Aspergillus novoparasiticus TaxID=986946 RepID=A0A5N6FAF3_9EURO|nr:hypothetical protein BDV33DRAFT_198103 [Aspergillus novoparasiticus]